MTELNGAIDMSLEGIYAEDKAIALETVKQWFNENDAAYLAKEDVVIHWIDTNPDTKRGQWVKYTMPQAIRIIRATRAGFSAMRFIKRELVELAAQELGRAYKQAVKSRSTVPPEFFNLERVGHFNSFEILTLCLLQALVGRGWNCEAVLFGEVLAKTFQAKGFVTPNRHLRWKLIRAVADEAGVVIRDRTNRLTVYGVGRFVAIQIEGIEDSIKVELTPLEEQELIASALSKFA